MPKFYNEVGYAMTRDNGDGVHVNDIIEVRKYHGDILRIQSRNEGSEDLNNNIDMEQQISIVADAFAYQNFSNIKFVKWMGVYWEVKSVDPSKRPRLILNIGGVYNGKTEKSPENI